MATRRRNRARIVHPTGRIRQLERLYLAALRTAERAALPHLRRGEAGLAAVAAEKKFGSSAPRLLRLLAQLFGRLARSVDDRLLTITGIDPSQIVGVTQVQQIQRTNLALIKRASTDQVQQLTVLFRTENLNALSREAAQKRIQQVTGIGQNRAKFWARDQASKFHGDLVRTRALAAGVTKYRWTTSRDERVRETHVELDRETFSWNDPPVTNDAGDHNHPGGDYNCRCTAEIVLD